MPDKYPPISARFPRILHGGDYNPDQWMDEDVWKEDMRLMKLAGVNAMTVGVFSWSALEPEEGRFEFGWLDRIMDLLAGEEAYAVLATPTGAKPAWMSLKYPEIRRVEPNGLREPHGNRHNHCPSSPVYRRKTAAINRTLAERYGKHPALVAWHLSNEYGGECHCDLCFTAFREWLRARYETLDRLNRAWWAGFWSHGFGQWEEITSVDGSMPGMALDWKRFVTHQTVDFMKTEAAPIRELTPDVAVTTNMMGTYVGLDYWRMSEELDVVSWDSYPQYRNGPEDIDIAIGVSFTHDMIRSMKGGRPFMLMESAPGTTNWAAVCKLKRPGVQQLEAIHAVAHGADTVQYFQWRKGRGGSEKFHGAVVDHAGHENTRIFQDVSRTGGMLARLDEVVGTTVRPEVALVQDWENRWAIEGFPGFNNGRKDYIGECMRHYRPYWRAGVSVDVIESTCDFAGYRILVAPMLYMLKPGVAERVTEFVRRGGTFVATFLTGFVDESDLCFLGGFPGPLREVLGVWVEETDALHANESNTVALVPGNALGLSGEYEAAEMIDVVHAETAKVLATFSSEFHAGHPAVTVNSFGEGKAYFIASRNEPRFAEDFHLAVLRDCGVEGVLGGVAGLLPDGVAAQVRTDGGSKFIFVMNFSAEAGTVDLGAKRYSDMLSGGEVAGQLDMAGHAFRILKAGE